MWVKIRTNIANQMAFINSKKIEAVLYEPDTNRWASKIMLSGGESIVATCAPDKLVDALKQEREGVADLSQDPQ